MSKKICAHCGQLRKDSLEGDLCPKCNTKQDDYKHFDTHNYSIDDFKLLDVRPHLRFLIGWGVLSSIVILGLAILGLIILLGSGDFGAGFGAVFGASIGIGFSNFLWRLSSRLPHPRLFERRSSSFLIAGLPGTSIGALLGALFVGEVLGIGGTGSSPMERVFPIMLGALILGPLIGIIAGVIVLHLREQVNKSDYLKAYEEWSQQSKASHQSDF